MPRSIIRDALGLAGLRLDLRKEAAQRRLVGGVAGENLVGERKASGVTTSAMTACTQSGRLSRL